MHYLLLCSMVNIDLRNINKNYVVEWHQSLVYIFISRTYLKVHLFLTKQHVNTVACLYRYYTYN